MRGELSVAFVAISCVLFVMFGLVFLQTNGIANKFFAAASKEMKLYDFVTVFAIVVWYQLIFVLLRQFHFHEFQYFVTVCIWINENALEIADKNSPLGLVLSIKLKPDKLLLVVLF